MMNFEDSNVCNECGASPSNNIKSRLVQKPTVSVIVPTLNEAKNLPLVLPYIPMDVVDEVILVDGRSTDGTVEVAKRLLPSIVVVMEDKRGKGAAMKRGYAEATGDILVVLDADGSNDPREIPRFVVALMEGADFVKGSRFASFGGGTTDMPRYRKYGNLFFTKMVNLLFNQSFTDLLYGFHAFWRHCLPYLDLDEVDGFEIDTAIYLQAVKAKLKIIDIPSFEGFRFYGVGKLQTIPDGLRVLRTILSEFFHGKRQTIREAQVGFREHRRTMSPHQHHFAPTGSNGHSSHGQNGAGNRRSAAQRVGLDQVFSQRFGNLSPAEFYEMVPEIMLTVMEEIGASSASMFLLDEEQQVVESYRVFGRYVEQAPVSEMSDVLSNGVAGWVIQNRQPLLITNTRNDSRWVKRPWEETKDTARSVLVMPYIREGVVLSILVLTRPQDRPFTPADLDMMNQITVTIQGQNAE
jgi:hypothetical protein